MHKVFNKKDDAYTWAYNKVGESLLWDADAVIKNLVTLRQHESQYIPVSI
jgi:hypothetical protein